MNEPISANREYKDSVFRMLYNKPETVLPLYSIKEGILADFLLSQRSEVIAMSIFEYDHEEELKKLGTMEREEGVVEGRSQSILLLLSLRGSIPEWLKGRILSETDIPVLNDWIRAADQTSSIEDFLQKNCMNGDLLITMGAGDVGKIGEDLLERSL